MAIEIERKFLVRDDSWKQQAGAGSEIRQGYLSSDPACSVRVRLAGDRAWLNIKRATGEISRLEFEYPIPIEDAKQILHDLCGGNSLDKTRYLVVHEGHTWEVDVFHGANAGLVVAEIELASEDEAFTRPDWLGEEVSHDPRYLNMNLVQQPFSQW